MVVVNYVTVNSETFPLLPYLLPSSLPPPSPYPPFHFFNRQKSKKVCKKDHRFSFYLSQNSSALAYGNPPSSLCPQYAVSRAAVFGRITVKKAGHPRPHSPCIYVGVVWCGV